MKQKKTKTVSELETLGVDPGELAAGISYTPPSHVIPQDMTVPLLLRQIAEANPRRTVIERKTSFANQWVKVSWREFYDEIRTLARGLIAWGVKPGDFIGIMAHTSYEWTLVDFAIQYAGAHAIPIYETDTLPQIEWIVQDAHLRAVFTENASLTRVIEPLLNQYDRFEHIWTISDGAIAELSEQAEEIPDSLLDDLIEANNADDLWTIIYTSGTTGKPKGVELSHRNVLHVVVNGAHSMDMSPVYGQKGAKTLLFLPMAHVFARFINLVAMYLGTPIGYSPDTKNLVADMQTFKPTYVLAVPRVFEKIYNAADAAAGRGLKLRTFRRFAKVAITYGRAVDHGKKPGALLRVSKELGDALIFSKLREITGGQLRYAISGGAPLGDRLGAFFHGIGLTVLEGYGLTETSAPTAVNRPNHMKIGTVGLAYPGCAVKTAPDGEILAKGDHVFRQYHNNPEATKEAFTSDGWFRTGDIGTIDDEGFVWITGRKKELIVTAGGKNVAPAELEDRLRAHPIISQVVVVGDQKPFVGALITLDAEALPQWLVNHKLPPMSVNQAVQDPQVIAAIDRAVKRTNEHVSRAESIRKFTILPGDFTIENGLLTPSLKVKRKEVLAAFAEEIERLYAPQN